MKSLDVWMISQRQQRQKNHMGWMAECTTSVLEMMLPT